MSESGEERLFRLLPKLYQQRDFQHGQPLRALMQVLEQEYQCIQTDIEALYDNWFVETCDEWTLPYLGDLVGVDQLGDGRKWHFTERRRVANTLAYRRRKGTASVLEHVIRDVCGWHCCVHETSRHVASDHDVSADPKRRSRNVDVRGSETVEPAGGPLSETAITVEIPVNPDDPSADSMESGQQKSKRVAHPAGLSVYLYRTRTYPLPRALVSVAQPYCFRFDGLGRDLPLFNFPEEQADVSCRAQRIHLPAPITRQSLQNDLDTYQDRYGELAPNLRPHDSTYYGPARSFHIARPPISDDSNGQWLQVEPWEMVSQDLSRWPTVAERAAMAGRHVGKKAVVDPELGRFVILDEAFGRQGEAIRVTYTYGFGDDLGGGPYQRMPLTIQDDMQVLTVGEFAQFPDLQSAARHWNETCQGDAKDLSAGRKMPRGVIQILDSGNYASEQLLIDLPDGAHLAIVAIDGMRPTLQIPKGIVVRGTQDPSKDATGANQKVSQRELYLQGLLIDGPLLVGKNKDQKSPSGKGNLPKSDLDKSDFEGGFTGGRISVVVSHCTFVPRSGHLSIRTDAVVERIRVDNSVTGPLRCDSTTALRAVNSVVGDGENNSSVAIKASGSQAPSGAPLELEQSTILGSMSGCSIQSARNVLFTRMPSSDALLFCSEVSPNAFRSLECGDPYFGQLAENCPSEIRQAGEGGAEPGAFHRTFRPQRIAGLRKILDEYAPVGMEVKVLYAT